MRTIKNLLSLNGRVFVYLATEELAKLFLENAEAEGFTFGDGVKPTERHISDIFALHRDMTINYVGWAGHMAYENPDRVIGERLIRIDYGEYISGREK